MRLTKSYLKKYLVIHIKLVDKLINTTNKEENQMIIKNINANKIKINEREKTSYD